MNCGIGLLKSKMNGAISLIGCLLKMLAALKDVRYYQEIAVNNAMAAIADGKQTHTADTATGTGKTFIAFQIAWKLYHTRWNLKRRWFAQTASIVLS